MCKPSEATRGSVCAEQLSQRPRSWRSLFQTALAAAGIVVISFLGLLVPSRTGDELSALHDIRVWILSGLSMLQFAIGALSLSAWSWSRAAIFGTLRGSAMTNFRAITYRPVPHLHSPPSPACCFFWASCRAFSYFSAASRLGTRCRLPSGQCLVTSNPPDTATDGKARPQRQPFCADKHQTVAEPTRYSTRVRDRAVQVSYAAVTATTVHMIGEKAADVIPADASCGYP
jgi:hypothetical protein